LKSNKEMKEFAHRILSSEARYATDAGQLTGTIHWYSGRMDVQDLAALKKELRQAWWTRAGEGRTAPLNEMGYQRVASMKSNAHMRAFMRRILNAANKRVTDDGAFDAMAPYYDGEISVQSFEKLQSELLAVNWIEDKDTADSSIGEEGLAGEVVDEMLMESSTEILDESIGSTAPLNQEGYEQVAALVSNKEMKKFAHRICKAEARYTSNLGDLTGAMHWYSGRRDVQDYESLKTELRRAWWTKAGEGRKAPLNEKGYQAVAAMKNNAHMRAFMRRILNAANKHAVDDGAFDAMAPRYDGEYGPVSEQSFEKLQQELLSAPWVVDKNGSGESTAAFGTEVVDEMLLQSSGDEEVSGATAPLTEEGYQQVAALKSNKEMKEFAHRILSSEARYMGNNGGELTGTMHWYSGRRDVQSLENLKVELRRAWWTKAGEGRTAPLNERGYQAVARMKSRGNMRAFMRRILNAAERKVTDEAAFDGLAAYYDGEISVKNFEQLQKELLSVSWTEDRP